MISVSARRWLSILALLFGVAVAQTRYPWNRAVKTYADSAKTAVSAYQYRGMDSTEMLAWLDDFFLGLHGKADSAVLSDSTKAIPDSITGTVVATTRARHVTTHSDSLIVGGTVTVVDSGLTLNGIGQFWQDLPIGALAMRPGVSSPTLAASGPAGGLRNYGFSASQANEIEFNAQTQHGQNETMYVHVHWMPTTTDTGHVVWGLEYSAVPSESVMRTVDTLWSRIAGADTGAIAGGVAWVAHLTNFDAAIICPHNSLSNIIICRLFRLGSHADDTYPQPAQFLSLDFHVKFTRLGSRRETNY